MKRTMMIFLFLVAGSIASITTLGISQNQPSAKAELVALANKSEQKVPLNVKTMDNQVNRAYQLYKRHIKTLEKAPEHALYVVRGKQGKLSLDSQYVVMNETVCLSPRTTSGGKTGLREYPVSSKLSLMDANGNILWTKNYDWAGTEDGGVGVIKVARGAKGMIAMQGDTTKNAHLRGQYPSIVIVYNKDGEEVYRTLSGGASTTPKITKNGRYFYIGESKPWPSKEEVWTIVDIEKGVKKEIICGGGDGTPQISEDGKIVVLTVDRGRKLFAFDAADSVLIVE